MSIFSRRTCVSFMTVVLVSFLQDASALDCAWGGSKSVPILPWNPRSCPTVLNNDNEMFCCKSEDVGFCCDFQGFLRDGDVVLISIGLVIAILLVVALGCCLTYLYKRRR